jgi:hypothetical protein
MLMPGTRRTPIARQAARPLITPRAIELFAELERARRARALAVDCSVSKHGYCATRHCRVCQRWLDLHAELHTELRLPPWAWPCLPRNPYPPGSPEAKKWRPGDAQKKLQDLLNEARRAAIN